jgi:hypothetical protein
VTASRFSSRCQPGIWYQAMQTGGQCYEFWGVPKPCRTTPRPSSSYHVLKCPTDQSRETLSRFPVLISTYGSVIDVFGRLCHAHCSTSSLRKEVPATGPGGFADLPCGTLEFDRKVGPCSWKAGQELHKIQPLSPEWRHDRPLASHLPALTRTRLQQRGPGLPSVQLFRLLTISRCPLTPSRFRCSACPSWLSRLSCNAVCSNNT